MNQPRVATGVCTFRLERVHSPDILSFTVFGKSESLATGIRSAGYFDGKKYYIPLHIHGINWMSGEEFAARFVAHIDALDDDIAYSVQDGMMSYQITQTVAHNLFEAHEYVFHRQTPYTLRARVSVPSGASEASLPIRIEYDDGTYASVCAPVGDIQDGYVNFVYHTDATKTIRRLQMFRPDSAQHVLDLSSFGILYGERDYDDFAAYTGAHYNIALNRALAHAGAFADQFSLTEGKQTIYAYTLSVFATKATEYSAQDGLYTIAIKLTYKAAPGATFFAVQLTPVYTEQQLRTTPLACMLSADGGSVYISMQEQITTLADAKTLIGSLKPVLLYPLATPKTVTLSQYTPPQLVKGDCFIELGMTNPPSATQIIYR